MRTLTTSKSLGLAAVTAVVVIWNAPALADVEFTSQPPTSASVGRTYSYRMTAVFVSDEEDDRDDEDDDGDGQCLIWSPDIPEGEQPPAADCDDAGVPSGQHPPAGQCRIWYPGQPPGQQPPPFDCDEYDDDDDRDGGDITFIARALPPWLEFDGEDTIFGTPRQEDVGEHRVRLRARADDDHDDQEFQVRVEAAPGAPPPVGADLAASISVTPPLASPGDPVSWTATARNLADADVANIVLETSFFGDAAFSIDQVDDSACSIEPRGNLTAVVCRWSPFATGASRSARVRGTAIGAGDILAVAGVSIVDAVPSDSNAANDSATVVLQVSESPVVADDEFPVLTLNGLAFITVLVGDPYEDPGATAIDDKDGNLTSKIVVDNPVDTSIIGRYSVTYDVVDSAGNTSSLTRTVEIVPREGVGGGGGGSVGITFLMLVAWGMFVSRIRILLSSRNRV